MKEQEHLVQEHHLPEAFFAPSDLARLTVDKLFELEYPGAVPSAEKYEALSSILLEVARQAKVYSPPCLRAKQ